MKHHAILAALVAGTLLTAPALAESDFPPSISVSGEATISAPPDRAEIEAGTTTDARTAREAAEANNTAMAKVLVALKGTGIEDRDVQTSRLSLQPQYAPNHNPPTVTGYRASNQVTVRLHDISKVAATIDALVSAGATDIGGINFTVSNASKLLDDARAQAIADARRKAEIYAKATGVTLGAPISISEGGAAPMPMFRAKMVGAPMAATPVAPGQETLSVTVNVSWAIKQGQ
ncbi:MAG TPA: SIMPL domain-containing protein [Bradyrhizobium sp.]|nr:SIMPL domain-containing protein [Bradyrhizobium sp.]